MSDRLLVLSWLWHQPEGRALFKAEHVNIWAQMVRRHCTLEIELACVTDMPEGIDPSIRIIEPPGFYDGLKTSRWKGGRPSCYRRLIMFSPEAEQLFGADRFVSMDLDCVIASNIDHLWDRDEDLVLNGPSQVGSRFVYNGSMLLMDAGARPNVYEEFTPEKAEVASRQYVGSDQAWLAYSLGQGEATWGIEDGVTRWGRDKGGALMFFPGHINPWNATADPWVGEHYRLDGPSRCLILGEKKHLWDDVKEQIGHGPFDHVIALPRSARAWNGKLSEVADCLDHAKLIARMYGCQDPVICGA